MALPLPGIYRARLDGRPTVVDRAEENPPKVGLQLYLPCTVVEDGTEKGKSIVAIRTVIDKNGAVMINEWTKLQKIFGAYPTPIEMFQDAQDDKEFEIDVQEEEWDGKKRLRVKWLNEIGGGGGMSIPKSSDPRGVVAKYGNLFRALAGGTQVNAPAKAPASSTAPSRPATPPPAAPAGSTADEAWAACCHANAGKAEADIQVLWFAAIDSVGKPQERFAPADWLKVKKQVEDNIPM